jgi:hypothetical protein
MATRWTVWGLSLSGIFPTSGIEKKHVIPNQWHGGCRPAAPKHSDGRTESHHSAALPTDFANAVSGHGTGGVSGPPHAVRIIPEADQDENGWFETFLVA